MASAHSVDDIVAKLSALGISHAPVVAHEATNSPAHWNDVLSKSSDATASSPSSYTLIKTLVFKAKNAKTAAVTPVVIVAQQSTETSSGPLGKKLGVKDMRLAAEPVLAEYFGVNKDAGTSLYALARHLLRCASIFDSSYDRVISNTYWDNGFARA